MTNESLVKKFFEAFSRGDLEQLQALMHPKGTWWVSGEIDGISGTYNVSELISLLSGVKQVYEEGALLITPTSVVSQDNKVAVEARSFATLKKGGVYANTYHFLIEIKENRVFRVKEYMDTLLAYKTFCG